MKITSTQTPFPCISIDNFIPSESLLRSAAESFNMVSDEEWVKYGGAAGQVQYCSQGRIKIPPSCLMVLDYISSNFDPSSFFKIENNVFPDTSYYGGGMMITPNSQNEGGFLGMHVDADVHGLNLNWKREFSAVLCLSEEYDSSFDLLVHNGKEHGRLPYKFNRLNVFKCSENSWHGFPEITEGMDRKTLGVMYWSVMKEDEKKAASVKAKFKKDLKFS